MVSSKRWTRFIVVAGILGLSLIASTSSDAIAAKKDQAGKKAATNKTGNAAKAINAGKVDVATLSQTIDQAIKQRLGEEKVDASPRSDDAEFLRRVYLDLTGVIPTADKVAEFLDSTEPNKRAKAIDELLASPLYGRHMGDIWQRLLYPMNSDNRRVSPEPLTKWLEKSFNENRPWDKFVTELMTASGSQEENAGITYFVANPTPDKMTDSVSRLFLGLQLQCAQCHNHPFTGWKQEEYWGMATFFYKVQPDNVRKAVQGGSLSVVEKNGPRPKKIALPESAKNVPAKFLQGEQPTLSSSEPYRPVLAKWMTSPTNPFFAKAMVNRMWAHFFGRGFVNPIDDMHEGNPASHPALLAELTQQFKENSFDLKYLIRAICNSETYQRTSKPFGNNEDDTTLVSHMTIKSLAPEELFDSLMQVSGTAKEPEKRQGPMAARRGPAGNRAQFAAFFRVDENSDPTEYDAGIPQALRLMNSPQLNRNFELVDQSVKTGKTTEQVIERLFLGTLSRRPSQVEMQRFTDYVAKHGNDSKKTYSDLLWALLNSSEFTLNH